MSFEIIMPEINNSPKNTKDAIILSLTQVWPQSSKEIYNKIKKNYLFNKTYQSVYKSLNELVEKKVIIKINKKYELNIKWIKEVQKFTDIVETNYYAKEKIKNFSGLKDSKQETDIIILKFDNYFDAEKYLYYFIKHELSQSKNKIVIEELNYIWKPLFYLRAEYNFYKKMIQKGHNFFFLHNAVTESEKESIGFYSKIGIYVKKNKNCSAIETIYFDDYYIQIFIPSEIKNAIKFNLENNKKLGLLNALEKQSKIKVIINKDTKLVQEMVEKKLKLFNHINKKVSFIDIPKK